MRGSLLLIFLIAGAIPGQAQLGGSLFGGLSSSGGERKGGSTTISSDTMNIDLAKNLAVFTGNVVVDDPQMNIKCHKMLVYLEDAKKEQASEKDKVAAGDERNKEISKIICIGDVLIVRKPESKEDEAKGEQKAIAGKADYDLKSGKILLTDKPVIMRGDDKLTGTAITIYRDSDRMDVEGGKILMKSATGDEPEDAEENPADSAPAIIKP